MLFADPRIPSRVWAKIDVRDGCWMWTGAFAGAPQIRWKVDGKQKVVAVRRILYEAEHGPTSATAIGGCNRHCVHPDHCVAGSTHDINAKYRSEHPLATVCLRGHVIADVGRYYRGSRPGVCRACHAERLLKQRRVSQARRLRRMSPERRRIYLNRSLALERAWREGRRVCKDKKPAITATKAAT